MPPMRQKAWMRRCARTPRSCSAPPGGRGGRARGHEAKARAFMRDCGDNPAYCMYERARALSLLPDAENPCTTAWTHGRSRCPLARAQAYYPARLAARRPKTCRWRSGRARRCASGSTAMRQAKWARATCARRPTRFPPTSRFCRRTRPRCGRPSCTPRVSYPVTAASGTPVMHAWEGCPEAGGATGYGSIADMEAGGYAMCPACQFGAESMGKVAAASTSIENGFEYITRQLPKRPGTIRRRARGSTRRRMPSRRRRVRCSTSAKRRCRRWEGSVSRHPRRDCLGVVAMVANLRAAASSTGFESSFVQEGGVLGARGRRLGGNAPARHGRRRALRALLAAGRIRRRRRRRRGGGPRGPGLLVGVSGGVCQWAKGPRRRDCAGSGRAAAGQRERAGSVGGRRARLVRAGARARAGGA